MAGLFILFQGNSLSSAFGVGFGAVFIILLGFILAVSMLQIASLFIYTLTNGNPARKRTTRLICTALFAPLICYAAVALISAGDLNAALEGVLRSPVFAWTPVAGWASEGIVALISGDVSYALIFFGLIALLGAVLIGYIALDDPDYYEDVLVATETAFEKKRAMAEGQVNTASPSAKPVKVAKTGVAGFGASTLLHKHLRESFRANRFGLWGLPSLLMVAGAALFALFLRGEDGALVVLMQSLMWAQVFLIGTGRGLKELYSHYLYLIPESSFSKVVWSNLETVLKTSVESLAIF
jgi:hypothetical protein